ncbi:MAG TPA: pirin family protein [Acidimicrobiia bacterium]|nr:pirin family protein [Acidimicrobiia bacterium]
MSSPVLQTVALGPRWPTIDPFLFCAHHDDAYPAGNDTMAPALPVDDRDLGMDFSGKDGWSMYHGLTVPGFPGHPHRGFETVTFVRTGCIDHSDSLGAAARFGRGDVQWLTAGKGIVHAEMFPLLARDRPNPLELFQIWLNLAPEDKLVDPYFTMLWHDEIPHVVATDADGRVTDVTVIAGRLGDTEPLAPPPSSWAARPDSDVAIWHVRMDADAEWTLPPAAGPDTARVLYVFSGEGARVGDTDVDNDTGVVVRADQAVDLQAHGGEVEVLLLQGRPIGAPVAQYGPFVMNTEAEIQQAFRDYQATQFGGWPWPDEAPTHGRDRGRFARHVDGRIEEREPATR